LFIFITKFRTIISLATFSLQSRNFWEMFKKRVKLIINYSNTSVDRVFNWYLCTRKKASLPILFLVHRVEFLYLYLYTVLYGDSPVSSSGKLTRLPVLLVHQKIAHWYSNMFFFPLMLGTWEERFPFVWENAKLVRHTWGNHFLSIVKEFLPWFLPV
jgi:hypothetical protein